MAWISQLRKKGEVPIEVEPVLDEVIEKEQAPPQPQIDAPQLAVLAPDIGGISSFRLKLFDDSATAELFIKDLAPDARRATHAFWALQDEPDVSATSHKEALVLIRANLTSNIVYVVSFVDLQSAWSFARFEAKRGLDLSHLLIYWASFAQVREELDTVTISPAQPPRTLGQSATPIVREAARTIDRYIETKAPEASVIGTPTESELEARAAAEAARRVAEAREAEAQAQRLAELAKQAEAEATERAEVARNAEAQRLAQEERNKAILEAAREAEEARLIAEAEAVRNAEAERLTIQAEVARLAEEARQEAKAAAARKAETLRIAAEATAAREVEEARAQAEAEARVQADADRLAFVEPLISNEATVMTPPEPVTSFPGDEETIDADEEDSTLPAATGVVFTHTAAPEIEDAATVEIPERLQKSRRNQKREALQDPTAEFPEEPSLSDFDIAYEVERLLRNRRWEKRDEPFGGFSSPPGRF